MNDISNTQLETYGENVSKIFLHLIKLEKKNITLGKIDETGLFTCDMEKIPINWVELNPIEHSTYDSDPYLYKIPDVGDILHSIKIYGKFQYAEIFQYNFLGGKFIYDEIDGTPDLNDDSVTILKPFPISGIPLLHIKNNIYFIFVPISPENEKPEHPIRVEFGYGFLDVPLRKQFNINLNSKENEKGVSIIHKSGIRYSVFGVDNIGYSINVLSPER